MRRIVLLLVIFGLFAAVTLAQQPSATPPDDQIVRISTNLIQIDVTVTDKNGKVVTGLGMNDFEVFENGERQNLSNLSFVSRTSGGATLTDRGNAAAQAVPGSPQQPRSAITRNTIAIVVDDLNLSFPSIYYTRRALRRFVDQQMRPDDLVAIIRTSGGVGALQQFTSEKRLLHAAIDKLRWNPFTASIDPLSSVSQDAMDRTERFKSESDHIARKAGQDDSGRVSGRFRPNLTQPKAKDYNDIKNANEFEAGLYAQSSLGTMRYIVSGMNELPGRKVMMLFSDGLSIGSESTKSRSSVVYELVRDLVDFANRSSVVVYTFDTKGMQSMSIQASDSTYEVIDGHRGVKERERLDDFRNSQDGLAYFAQQTGGKALLNSNDLNGGIQRALDEQAGYYLLAYQPVADEFDPTKRKFNKLEVRVKRPGLNVNYRSGFFSSDNNIARPELSVERQIASALMSPFSRSDIALDINALFANDPVDGPYVRSFLHIDAKSLKFQDDPEGWKKATFDIAAVTFGNNGMPVETKQSQYTIKAKGPTYDAMLQRGFVYVLMMPLKQPGLYQYRVAVRDSDTGKIGTASQLIDVPDLTKRKLAVSSLAVEDVSMSVWQNIAAGKVGNKPGQIQVPSTLLYDTVLRQFRAGTVLRYGFEVYNAKSDGSSMPKLETQASILQNNAVVIEGNLNKIDASSQNDPKHVKVSGAIMLKDTLQPGDYLLRLTVFDRSGKQTAMQILPFEIVK